MLSFLDNLCVDEVALYWFVCQFTLLSWQFIDNWIIADLIGNRLDDVPQMAAPFYACAGVCQMIQAACMVMVFIPTTIKSSYSYSPTIGVQCFGVPTGASLPTDADDDAFKWYWIPFILTILGVQRLFKAYSFCQQIENNREIPLLQPFVEDIREED